jgi:hypothetical protein
MDLWDLIDLTVLYMCLALPAFLGICLASQRQQLHWTTFCSVAREVFVLALLLLAQA